MPNYEIEQYEIHTQTYRVEASNEAEAIKMLFDGEADPVDNGFDYIEVCEDMGLPAEKHRELADQFALARRFCRRARDSVDPQR